MKYVIGLGKTGTSLLSYYLNRNIPVMAWDDIADLQEKAQLMGCTVKMPRQAPWHMIDEVLLSPGIPIIFPEPHPVVTLAKQYHVPIHGDIEVWYQMFQHLGCKYIGVTGTNGKSTTHAIIDYMLNKANLPHFSGGNSGTPIFDQEHIQPGSIVNLEMSSYQLDTLDKMTFDAGVILNITPDHLDRYGNIENYILSKENQIQRVRPKGLKVVGIDTPHGKTAYDHLVHLGHQDIIPISTKRTIKNGIYSHNRCIYADDSGKEIFLGNVSDNLPGDHNLENVMAAMLVCKFMGITYENFFKWLPFYPGLEHRQEKVLETSKALFINDSKATNAEATLPALKAYTHIYWIAGGLAKEEGIRPLLTYLASVEKIFLIGDAAENFQKDLSHLGIMVYNVGTLDKAIDIIYQDLSKLDHKITVLLSPACASQDQFQNFEHRGRVFKQLIFDKFGKI